MGAVKASNVILKQGGAVQGYRNTGNLLLPMLRYVSGTNDVQHLSSGKHLFVDGSENVQMAIDSSGNVGIGTDNPDALLHVDGAIQAKSSIETYQALSGTSVSIDCSAASVFSLSTTGTTTFSFTNVPSTSNTALGLTLEITAGGTHTLNWPASVKWAGGSAPDAPASGETNIYGFYTRNAGTTWYGFLSGAAMA